MNHGVLQQLPLEVRTTDRWTKGRLIRLPPRFGGYPMVNPIRTTGGLIRRIFSPPRRAGFDPSQLITHPEVIVRVRLEEGDEIPEVNMIRHK